MLLLMLFEITLEVKVHVPADYVLIELSFNFLNSVLFCYSPPIV